MIQDSNLVILISAAGAGLAASVGVLFRRNSELTDKHIELSRDVGKLEGNQNGVTALSLKVLEVVKEASSSDPPEDSP